MIARKPRTPRCATGRCRFGKGTAKRAIEASGLSFCAASLSGGFDPAAKSVRLGCFGYEHWVPHLNTLHAKKLELFFGAFTRCTFPYAMFSLFDSAIQLAAALSDQHPGRIIGGWCDAW
jgi:hypothetical protein